MLFSFDTAWQKSGGGPVPPGPPGFDATVENVFLHTMILGQPQYPDL